MHTDHKALAVAAWLHTACDRHFQTALPRVTPNPFQVNTQHKTNVNSQSVNIWKHTTPIQLLTTLIYCVFIGMVWSLFVFCGMQCCVGFAVLHLRDVAM